MPAKHTLHVAFTKPLVRYFRDQVTAGRHQTASDVVRTESQALMLHDASAKRPDADAVSGQRNHG